MPTALHAPRRLAAPWAVATALAVLGGGCGSIVNQLEATQMAGAMLLQTPDVQNAGTTIKGATVFTLEFASINTSAISTGQASQAATPTDGAEVSVQYTDATGRAQSIPAPGQGNGLYTVSSLNSALTYVVDQVYTAVIVYAGTTYQLTVTAPTPIGLAFDNGTAGTLESPNPPVLVGFPASSSLTIARVPQTDTSVAFYQMSTVTNGSPAFVTTNAPQSVVSFLEFILPGGSTPYEAPTFDISSSYFQSGATYLVTLTSVAQGAPVTDNPSLGTLFSAPGGLRSTFLAGAAAGGIVETQSAQP